MLRSRCASPILIVLGLTLCAAAPTLIACETGTSGDGDGDGDDNQVVTVNFAGKVGTADFACGDTYSDMGSSATAATPLDFKFYIHDVRLVNDAGDVVTVTLDEDTYQRDGVALLDFEDGTGTCANGTSDTHTAVTGTVPQGAYNEVRFTVGVPFALNHADVASAITPLNLSSMFWNWNGGYKFIRIELGTTGVPLGYRLHLGSTGCDGDMTGNVTTCTAENRAEIALSGFDVDNDTVAADLKTLYGDIDLDFNTDETPPGCMATPDDPECAPVFKNLGLPFGAAAAGSQTFFRIE